MSLGILDGIVQTFELATQTWFSTLFPIAQNLFFALMVIQIAWSGIWWTVVRNEGGEHVLVLLLRQVFVLAGLNNWGLLNPITGPMILFTCLVLILCYAWMAGVLLVYLVESYIVLGGGVVLLGFAGSRFTASLADGYLVYVFRVGVKLFT